MARLKGQNLSSFTPAQMKFWKGLKHANALAPGDMSFKIRGGFHNKRHVSSPSHGNTAEPDTPIAQLALNAASWLADHHTREVAETGRDRFIAARVQEITTGVFPPKYWEPCPLYEETTRIAYPTCQTGIAQPPAKFQTPGSENTHCVYTTSDPSTGDAGYQGRTGSDGYFRDIFLKEKQYLYTIPPPPWACGVRPLFSRHSATWTVTHDHENHQPWCSLYKSTIAAQPAQFTARNQSVDAIGRYFYYQYAVPVPTVPAQTLSMTRSYVVDAGYLNTNAGYNPDAVGYCLLQIAPASCRGIYHFNNFNIDTTQQNTAELFVARPDDSHDPACAPFTPTVYSWAFGSNPYGHTYPPANLGAPCDAGVWITRAYIKEKNFPAKPLNHPWRHFASLPLRGSNYKRFVTVEVIPYGDALQPRPNGWGDYRVKFIHGPAWGTITNQPGGAQCSVYETFPIGDSYAGWGYEAWDACRQRNVYHVFPGPRPTAAQFAADWAVGKYPL